MTNLKILLTLNPRGKAIPYPAAAHDDGTQTHAFTSLKGRLALVPTIEEAKGVPAYALLLNALNAAESPFFSIACEKAFNSDRDGHWASGFMEFAFNFAELVGDAATTSRCSTTSTTKRPLSCRRIPCSSTGSSSPRASPTARATVSPARSGSPPRRAPRPRPRARSGTRGSRAFVIS